MVLPQYVKLVEVGPRDGLQNEKGDIVPTSVKLELIRRLAGAGLPVVECTSFVSPKWIPQMADHEAVCKAMAAASPDVAYPVLTPNLQGFREALAAGAREVAVFAAATDEFSKRNTNCTVAVSLDRLRKVAEAAKAAKVPVRGYLSCCLGCPYAGEVAPSRVVEVTRALLDMGCYEVAISDTIGTGTPGSMLRLLDALAEAGIPLSSLAVHCHDTYGQALANIAAALQRGVSVVDCAVGGLGGCPYAKGATGNVATEDVLYMLQGMGISTNVSMERLLDANEFIFSHLGRATQSRVARALLIKREEALKKQSQGHVAELRAKL